MPFSENDFGSSGSFSEVDFAPEPRPKRTKEQVVQEVEQAQARRPQAPPLSPMEQVGNAAYWPVRALSGQDFLPAVEEAAAGGLNKAINFSARVQGLPEYGADQMPYEAGRPIMPIPAAHDPEVASFDRALLKFVEGMTTPGNAALLPLSSVSGPIGIATRAQFVPPMVQSSIEQGGIALDPSQTPDSRKEAAASALLGGVAVVGAGKSLEVPRPRFTEADFTPKPVEAPAKPSGGIGGGMQRAVARNQEAGGLDPNIMPKGQEVESPAKPEIVKLGASKFKNPQGDPIGTLYHASPEDWATWNDLIKKPLDEPGVWPEREAIKNKYGGMPPEPPKVLETKPEPSTAVPMENVEQAYQRIVETGLLGDNGKFKDNVAASYYDLKHTFYDRLLNSQQKGMNDVIQGKVEIDNWLHDNWENLSKNFKEDDLEFMANKFVDHAQTMQERLAERQKQPGTTRSTKLYGPIPGSFLFDPDFWHGAKHRVQQAVDLSSRKTVPAMMRADANTGNALVEFAMSRSEKDKSNVLRLLVKNGLAIDSKKGITTLGDFGVKPITFTRKGKRPRTMLVREDVAGEVRQALQGHSELEKGIGRTLLDISTDLQTRLGVDLAWHSGNILAGVNSAQRATFVGSADILGSREINTVIRLGVNAWKRSKGRPEFTRALNKLTKIGAGRGEIFKPGVLGNDGPSRRFLRAFDEVGRVTLSELYDELVNAKLVTDTPHGRREMVNHLGQYNSALMSRSQQLLRESGLSPFIVAGKNFNSLAIQKLMFSPGLEAANKAAAVKMRLMNMVGMFTSLVVTPILANYLLTGTPTGRKGVPPGAIDTGKTGPDGEPIYFDAAQMYLARRGARITGLGALQKGIEKGEDAKTIAGKAALDALKGFSHPYAGPGVRTAADFVINTAKTPNRIGKNAVGALKRNLNPTAAMYFKGQEEGGSIQKEGVQTFGGALGFKMGPKPSFEDRKNKESQAMYGTNFASLRLSQKAKVQTKVNLQAPARSDKQREEASVYQVHSEFDRLKEIKSGLSSGSRQFLEKNRLNLPNVETSLRKSGATIPLDKDQADKLIELTTKYYEEGLQSLSKRPTFDSANAKSKERQFDSMIHSAKNKARRDLKLPRLQ